MRVAALRRGEADHLEYAPIDSLGLLRRDRNVVIADRKERVAPPARRVNREWRPGGRGREGDLAKAPAAAIVASNGGVRR